MVNYDLLKNKWFYFQRKKKDNLFNEPICKLQLKANYTIGNSPNFNESNWDIEDNKIIFYSGQGNKTTVFDNINIDNGVINASGKFLFDHNITHEIHQTSASDAKINIYKHQRLTTHRSGWPYALDCLMDLHSCSGVIFDDFIDASFSWDWTRAYKEFTPYKDNWIGVMHNPFGICHPFSKDQDPNEYFKQPKWKESLRKCLGIYTLSKDLAEQLSKVVNVPVENLIHPTGHPEEYFSWDKFIDNKSKSVVQVGWWMRKLLSIFELPVSSLGKIMLHLNGYYVGEAMNEENKQYFKKHNKNIDISGTKIIYYLPNMEYDELLSKNVVFLDLYGSSANNAVVECIIRNTPMLINKLPSVVEYIGEDYPLYFSSLEDAAEKVEDLERVKAAHEYLVAKDKTIFSGKYFVDSMKNSKIYRNLS